MAANNLKGLTVKIGGDTKNLSDALKGVNSDIRTLQADLRAVNSALKLDPSNVEAVAMKQELLSEAVDATREKLEILREAQRQADEQIANGTEVDQQAYRSLRAEIVRAESSLSDYERQLTEMGEAAEEAADDVDDLGDAADDAGREIDDAGDAADDAADRFEELADSAREGVDRMNTGFSNLANGAKTTLTAVTGAFAAMGAAMLYASESTVEYRTNIAKLETAFEDAGHSAETAGQTYKDFYGFLGDEGQATEASQHLAQLTNDQKALSEWTDIARGAYSIFGSSLPIESMLEAANETSKTGQLTGALADALNWAGVNEEAFQAKLDACTTSQEREALIRETLNGIYAEAGEKYQENAKDLIESNEAQVRYTDAMAKFGEKAQPILTAVRNGFAAILEAASGFLENVDMEGITAAIESAFAWFIDTAIPAIKDAIQWVIDHKDLVLGIITAIGAGFLAWNIVSIVSGAIQAFTGFASALKLVTSGQMALNAAMKANIIGIIITAVAALVAAFIYLWNNCEGFRNFFINMWEGIKKYFSTVVAFYKAALASIVQFFTNAWNGIKAAWSAVTGFFSGIWSGIKNTFSSVGSWFSNIFQSAWNGIKNAFSGITGFFSGIWNNIKSIFSNVGSAIATGIKNAVSTAVNGVLSTATKIINGFISAINVAISVINAIPGVKISKLKKLSVPAMAKGGIVDRATLAMIGEDGKEAVMPLEKNTGWMDTLAQKISYNVSIAGNNGVGNAMTGADYSTVLASMQRTMSTLSDKLDRLQIVLDTGAVVGGIATEMDAALGRISVRKGRGQ